MTADPAASPDAPRVLLIAADPLARSGLALALAALDARAVVSQVASVDDAAAAQAAQQPDVALWDLGWDAAAVPDRVADIDRVALPAVVLLPDDTYASDALAAGARGVMLRNADSAAVLAALRAVARGLVVLDAAVAAAVVPVRDRASTRPSGELTSREREVLQWLAAGLANKAIAQKLAISEHTVKFHVNAVLSKLGVQSRTEAVVRAARLGLVIL